MIGAKYDPTLRPPFGMKTPAQTESWSTPPGVVLDTSPAQRRINNAIKELIDDQLNPGQFDLGTLP